MRKLFAPLLGLGALVVSGIALAQDNGVQAIIGNVFLQNTTPGTPQVGHATLTGTFRAGQVFVQQGSIATIPVVGNNTSNVGRTLGGSFSTASPEDSIALRGTSTALTGNGIGVNGIARGPFGIGVYAQGTTGIRAEVTGTGDAPSSKPYAGHFINNLGVTRAKGIQVDTDGAASCALFNHSSPTGSGVTIQSSNGANILPALSVTSVVGNAVDSRTQSATKVAVSGRNISGSGVAFAGSFKTFSPDGGGLTGEAPNTGNGVGVLGLCQAAGGFGLFSNGNSGATGTKSFVIDHPLDPENRYLKHYSAEGDQPRNVYQGTVVTGRDGYAWVTLPAYYESINRDGLVQLTVVDSSADFVMAKVSQDVKNGKFQIRSSRPVTRVNWRVEAVRNDRWVQRNGAEAEPVKPREFRGKYLEPELYGKPAQLRQWNPAAAAGATRP